MNLDIPAHVVCIAAAKTQSVEKIQSVIKMGISHIGENYLQEALDKHQKHAYANAKLHFIGHLQSKKCKDAVLICDSIDSVDSLKLANKLDLEASKINKIQDIMIQINIGEEPQKSGISTKELPLLIDHINKTLNHLNLTGLMCIPPHNKNPRNYFKKMKELCNKHNLANCSMGMSSDYKIAIKEGATHIRLGTAIFGTRNT